MNTTIGSNFLPNQLLNAEISSEKLNYLKEKQKEQSINDDELMKVCKSFETYMVEQVYKEMQKTVPENGEKSPYLEYFGDMLYGEHAKNTTEQQGLGLAQMLYESMKRNS